VVTVTHTDRLARSTFDLFAIVKRIVDAKGQFRSLAEPWADTGTSTGRLMLAVLGGLADVERDLIRTRTAEGQKPRQGPRAAQGPTAEADPQQQKEARRRRVEGLHSKNWHRLTMSGERRFRGYRKDTPTNDLRTNPRT
jgi:DNA invertase Pin-like site-specific DNA recombinase